MRSATSLCCRGCEKERGEAHVLFPSNLRFELGTADEHNIELLDEVRDDAIVLSLGFDLREISMDDAYALKALCSDCVSSRRS